MREEGLSALIEEAREGVWQAKRRGNAAPWACGRSSPPALAQRIGLRPEFFRRQVYLDTVPLEYAVGFVAVQAQGLGELVVGNLLLAIQFDEKRLLGRSRGIDAI